MNPYIDVAILSVFCAGGLFAYGREALRLHRLIVAGKVARARVLRKDMDDSGSESIAHYVVTYAFEDDEGNTLVDQRDLNRRRFFDDLALGDTIEVLYQADAAGNSYPVGQIRSDRKLSCYIAVAILVFWVAMAWFFMTH